MSKLKDLQTQLGYYWDQLELLEQALQHSSWANEQVPRVQPNERLEFLGDAVLDLISAEHLMATMPDSREGPLSQARSLLVMTGTLAQKARELGLGEHLLVGKGSLSLRDVDSVLADTLEAIIGAAYMDGGMVAARGVVFKMGVLK